MYNWVRRITEPVRHWLLGFRVRKAKDITDSERETFERYGEQIVATILVNEARPWTALEVIHASEQAKVNARDWLTERADIQARRDRWIPLRDFILEIVVICLIGWEIILGYKQEKLQSENFKQQQTVLNNLTRSSQATADTLAVLKTTTELELKAVQESKNLSERSANAAESSAATSSQAVHLSERAYLTVSFALSGIPKAGEVLRVNASITNAGRTTAVDVEALFRIGVVPKEMSEEAAREEAFTVYKDPHTSKSILGPGQMSAQTVDMPRGLTAEEENK